MPIELLRGMRDYGPGEAIRLREITSKVEDVFRRFGFYPIETPSLESTETLNAKAYGREAEKEMYTLDDGKSGLIYDLTVPLARYVSMNKGLGLPFKRYQIAKAWRRDEPQRMRSRELIQADIDIVGSAEPTSEAEAIAATAIALEGVGVTDYTILISSRVILNAIMEIFKVPEDKRTGVMITIDKLGKISREKALEQISESGVGEKQAEALLNFINEEMENAKKLQKIKNDAPSVTAESDRLSSIISLLGNYGINGAVKVDFSLARGLGYYTGTVWELVAEKDGKRLPTIAAGGRYDGLIGIYSKTPMPAVGSSIGLSRVYEVVDIGEAINTYATVYVANIGQENVEYALKAANTMRSNGIRVDLNLTARNISKQLEYANAMRIKYVAIVGGREKEQNMIRLRDMGDGSEELLSIEDVLKKLKG